MDGERKFRSSKSSEAQASQATIQGLVLPIRHVRYSPALRAACDPLNCARGLGCGVAWMSSKREVAELWIRRAKKSLKHWNTERRKHATEILVFQKGSESLLSNSPESLLRSLFYDIFSHASINWKDEEVRKVTLSKDINKAFAFAGERSGLNILSESVRSYNRYIEMIGSELHRLLSPDLAGFDLVMFMARKNDALILEYLVELYDRDEDEFHQLLTAKR